MKFLLVKTSSSVQNYEKIIRGKLTLMMEFYSSDFWVAQHPVKPEFVDHFFPSEHCLQLGVCRVATLNSSELL